MLYSRLKSSAKTGGVSKFLEKYIPSSLAIHTRIWPHIGIILSGREQDLHGLTRDLHLQSTKMVLAPCPDLRVFTDCTTLLGEITCKSQRKEILGVLTDIRSIFTSFASIFFFHVSRSENKGVSSPVCIELGLRHVSFWAS
ncbi:hypothetical protein DY000_02011509 [Brassica cretica]|uniref:RNase H type-1 domain-containing protein n=1 Tax=Brassica cretica TaxID=69181 RepID=A0ABQ7D072_BRACR|nr:hypothetical protein DY000_02011509 [Brassica cretica]